MKGWYGWKGWCGGGEEGEVAEGNGLKGGERVKEWGLGRGWKGKRVRKG